MSKRQWRHSPSFAGRGSTKEERLNLCGDTCGMICREHFYNGHNPLGKKECWLLKTAAVVIREIQPSFDSSVWVRVETLDCFYPERKRDAKWLKDAGLV